MPDSSSEDWERRIGCADPQGTIVDITYMAPEEDHEQGFTSVVLTTGGANLRAAPTPEALRQWAAAMLDAADAMDGAGGGHS